MGPENGAMRMKTTQEAPTPARAAQNATTGTGPYETAAPERDRDRNARLWLQSINPDQTPEQRLSINAQIDDPLVLLAAVAYSAAYVHLQSECAAYDLSQGRNASANERISWLRADAETAVQCHIEMLTLLYQAEDHGGPAGTDLYPEIKKASRQILAMAQTSAARVGQDLDLNKMANQGERTLSEETRSDAEPDQLPEGPPEENTTG